MTALYDPDDYARDADLIAQWAKRYHPAAEVDEDTMRMLVAARICWYLGDRPGWELNQVEARQRLYAQGLTRAQALDAIRRADDAVTELANAAVFDLQSAGEAAASIGTVDDFLTACGGHRG